MRLRLEAEKGAALEFSAVEAAAALHGSAEVAAAAAAAAAAALADDAPEGTRMQRTASMEVLKDDAQAAVAAAVEAAEAPVVLVAHAADQNGIFLWNS